MRLMGRLAPLLLVAGVGGFACGGIVEDAAGSKGAPRADSLKLTVANANVVHCFCRHGCGPGLDGEIAVLATNAGDAAVTLDVRGLELRGKVTIDLPPGLLYNEPPITFGPTESRTLLLRLQPDTAPDFPTGSYEVVLDVEVASERRTATIGAIDIAHRSSPQCGK